LISIIGYGFIFSSLFLMVDYFRFNQTISFILVYGLAYILLYGVQLKFLYFKEHDYRKLFRYFASIGVFYIGANILFNIGLYLGIHYLISTGLTILILMPLRLF